MSLHIGFCRLEFHLPGNHSLKGKRQASRSVTAKIRNRFNVAVAESENNELWQHLTLAVSCLSNDPRHANQMLSKIVEYLEQSRDLELLDYEIEIISGF